MILEFGNTLNTEYFFWGDSDESATTGPSTKQLHGPNY